MKRWFLENLGLKVLAFFIACALWAYVGSRQVLEQRIALHVELTDIPAGMTVDPTMRTTISVVFSGRKDEVLELDPDELNAVMSLRGIEASQQDEFVHPTVKVQPLPQGVAVTIPVQTVHLIPLSLTTDSISRKKKKHSR